MTAWAFILACVLALGLTPLAWMAAFRLGVVDDPDHRKIHRRPTALLGGVAVFLAIAAPVLWLSGVTPGTLALFLGASLFLLVGLIDDVWSVGAPKLAAEFGIAFLVVFGTGQTLHLPWAWAGAALTILWIVGVANAFNCLDCADGVSSSTGLVAAAAFLVLATMTHQRFEAMFAAVIVGATLGFLAYNFPPAQIFLGDAGSLALGYLVAILAVRVSPGVLSTPALAAKAVVLAIPIYDIIRVHVVRFANGERTLAGLLTSTGKDHLPHRLLDAGLSPRSVALVIAVASAATGSAGVMLATVHSVLGAVLIGVTVILAVVLLEREWGQIVRRPAPLASASGINTSDGE